jgi:very-short-patch-repair endonuclease
VAPAVGDGRRILLDACPEARVDVELDGAAFHGSRAAREKDLRRDSALAVLGWVVLRFSYARLVSDPEGCRQEIEAVVRLRLARR